MLFGADIIRNLGESLNHTCESKIGHVKVDEGRFTVYISGIAKYDHGIVSQSLWYNNWHENILEISSLVDAHHSGAMLNSSFKTDQVSQSLTGMLGGDCESKYDFGMNAAVDKH
jgi:hypothetical protein